MTLKFLPVGGTKSSQIHRNGRENAALEGEETGLFCPKAIEFQKGKACKSVLHSVQ